MTEQTTDRHVHHEAVPDTRERSEARALDDYRLTGTGPAECADCGQPVIVAFVRGTATQTTPKAEHHKLVLDSEPNNLAGTIEIVDGDDAMDPRTFCRVLSDNWAARRVADGKSLYVPHSATCPGSHCG